MSNIKVLPPEITNLIAAGEVVERPASIVKELIENSLDAGATRIRVNIQGGGRKLVQVADNGCGMDREDAILCLEPHATSKIKCEEDVERIRTMGFRGEALPSIAAVTRFNILTRRQEDKTGSEVIVNGGRIEDVRDAGAAPGTTITAKNLFFNMPVRRKFLRSQQTESIHIQNTVQLQALANPQVGFELIMDGRKVFKVVPGADVSTRASMLLGKSFTADMISVDYSESDIRVYGFAARPGVSRSTRKEQTFFINSRPVASDVLFHAVREAYHTMVMKGRYAPVLLFLDLHTGLVDVNVHPQKREVRFRNNTLVGSVVANAVKKAIMDFQMGQHQVAMDRESMIKPVPSSQTADSFVRPTPSPEVIRPGFSRLTPEDLKPAFEPVAKPEHSTVSTEELEQIKRTADSIVGSSGFPNKKDSKVSVDENMGAQLPETEPMPAPAELEAVPFDLPEPVAEPFDLPEAVSLGSNAVHQDFIESDSKVDIFSHLRVIGNLGSRYLLAEGEDGMVVIDKTAAHRRIVYEKILEKSAEEENSGQPLLIPVTVEASNHDRLMLTKNIDYFLRIGFNIEHFGGNTYIISAVPACFPHENIVGLLQNILDELSQSATSTARANEVKLAGLAAKYAVPVSRQLKSEEVTQLLHDLAATKMPYTCPVGRPTMINYAFSELESRFGRKGR